MVHCCVPFCKSRSGKKDPGVSFHEFPIDEELCTRWKQSISREDLVINDKSASTVVCSKHFLRSDYVPNCRIKKLLPGTVPTVFYHIPSDTAPSPKKPRPESALPNALPSQKHTKVKDEPVELLDEGSIEVDNFVKGTASIGTQATSSDARRASIYLCMVARLRSQVAYLRSERKKLRQQLAVVAAEQEVTEFYHGDEHHASLEKIVADAQRGDITAISLLYQIDRYAKST